MKKLIQILFSFLIAMIIITLIICLCLYLFMLIPIVAIVGAPLIVISGFTYVVWDFLFGE